MVIPNYGFGGAQKVFADHSRLLEPYAEVVECVFNDWEEKRIYNNQTPYESLKISGGGGVLKRITNFTKRISAFKKFKNKYAPDVTISHLEGADYVNLLSGGNDKKIIVIHGSKQSDQNITGITGWLRHRLMMPWLYKRADKIITVSKDIKQEMIHSYGIDPQKVISLPNFFDCAAIAEKAALDINQEWLPLFDTNAFKIITFARLATQKNLSVLFPIMAALKKKDVKVKLYILGDGELKEQLIAEARLTAETWTIWDNHTIPDTNQGIYFLGYQPNPHAFLKHANLYLMTSLWEGFPMALCEAMASGIAVMAADCPTGPREILDSMEMHIGDYGVFESGSLMPMIETVHDKKGIVYWADTIKKLAATPQLLKQTRENALITVQQYDHHNIGIQWIETYLSV